MNADLSAEDIRYALGENHPDAQPQPLPGAQGSAEWFAARRGCVTASRFKDVLDFNVGRNGQRGKESTKRAAYRKEVVIERVTSRSIEHYMSGPMRDGIEREPVAKMAYEARTGHLLVDHGFIRHPSIAMVGGSPDARIGDDGGLEIKCPTPLVHLGTLLGGMDAEHMPQVQGLMWITDAQWWDFCSYCPHFDEPLRTYVQRVARDDAYIEALEKDVRLFLAEVEQQVTMLRKIAAEMRPRRGVYLDEAAEAA